MIRFSIAIAALAGIGSAQNAAIKSFSVGSDQTLTYPNGPADPPYLINLPDEHTTIVPPASPGAPYLIFGASSLSTGNLGGAVVLQTTDLVNFTFAAGYNRQVFAPPQPINQCNPAYQTEFDGNYAAPGSVVQDPTLPAGNLIIIYEAENHCPGGVYNPDYYATVGFARSSDNGKTWPAPVNGPAGGAARYPALQNSIPQPSTSHPPLGDAIPSAFVDQTASGDSYLYVVYGDHQNDGTIPTLRIARAQLGTNPLTFLKWNNGSFSGAAIGGDDTAFLPAGGCTGSQMMGEISRNDDLGLYLALFVCNSASAATAAWYYSTATSLDLQDWSIPQMVENSQFPVTSPCSSDGRGDQFDGWYPSSMSAGAAAGHTKLTGIIFYQNGCDTGARVFTARTFTITAAPGPLISKVANAEGQGPTIAPNTWVEVQGSNLAPAGDTRTWQNSDFKGGVMPTNLDGVSVTVNGKPAFIYYISPSQINILTPPDAMSGPVEVTVTNNGLSGSATAQAAAIAPSFFVFSDQQHVIALHLNGTFVGPPSFSSPGYTFTPATPGETVVVYANGFGPTSVPVVSGSSTQSGTLSPTPVVTIGGVTAQGVLFAGLVSPGLFQFNVTLPQNVSGGDEPIMATYNGAQTQSGAVLTLAGTTPPTSAAFYVSPSGKDSWSGTLASANAAGTDGPFATFDRARSAVQTLNKTGLTQISVQFRAGTYYLPATEQFTAADSGSASLSIVYQNYPGETPVISGGVRVLNWTNTTGNTWKANLPAATQYFESLFYNGVRRLRPRLGASSGNPLGTYYRFANTVYLNAAGPPATAPNPNCSVYVAGSGWACYDRFLYNPSDPISASWKNLAPATGNPCGQPAGNQAIAGDIEVIAFERYETATLRISCIDAAKNIVYLTGPTAIEPSDPTATGFLNPHRYVIENIQDELTQPGQYFLDRSTTPWTLTYLANPGENPNSDTVVIPQVPQPLAATGLTYVTFQGLTFEHDNYTIPAAGVDPSLSTVPAAVSFQNSQNVTFDSSVVAHTSGVGLDFTSCIGPSSPAWCVARNASAVTSNNSITNSAFYDLGGTGIRVGVEGLSVDIDANVPQYTTVQNNVVEGYGRLFPALQGILQGQGHNNSYSYNDVYDGYHGAIAISLDTPDVVSISHDNLVSYNHVYNLLQGIMNDGGSIRFQTRNLVGASPAGNKILNNRIHDISDASALDSDGYGGDGIYIDNQSGLIDVENNLVYRASGSPMNFAGGPQNPNEASTVHNNIFAFGRTAMLSVGNPYENGVPASVDQIFTASSNLLYFDRTSASSPAFYVQGGCTYSGGFAYASWESWATNLYWRTDGQFATDPQAFHVQPKEDTATSPCADSDTGKWTFLTFADWQKQGEDTQSVVQNPGFNNPAYPADDYTLPKGSPGVGFVVFDYTQAGRLNPVILPPAVAATFPTQTFNPATDF